jgi:transcriptional regulator with GAF, ATPase, and Fis domain/tRNA A-37 threonylcarbamoyl transferase component Bud32
MQTIANRYDVLDELGTGGISTVFKVRDTRSDRIVALKRVEPTRTSEEELARFEREFRFLSRIDHENIVTVHETGLDGSLPFFTMEYLEGQTLSELLAQPDNGFALALKRDPASLSSFLSQVCRALSYIHEQGTVHRDIKPSNVMVLPNGGSPRIKVLDLGLAKFRDTDPGMATRSAQILGTVHYSAPEQIRNLNVDGRADLYSLGAILYEIMTGRRPFSGDSAVNVAMQHLNELPVPPRVHDLDVPHHMQLTIMKLLEKDPDRRYRSPEDLIIDINNPDVVDEIDESAVSAPPLLLHPRFLGRREPAARARTMMTQLRSGNGRTLTVSGEPGIGKTRFLNELCADAKVMGFQVLAGTCYREASSPYQPIITAIREGLGERSLWNWVDKEDRFPLARLFPELKDETVDAIPDEYQDVDQKTIIAALARLLQSASAHSPIILSVDDLQWSDNATLASLTELAGTISDLPIAILVGHRPYEEEAPDFLPDAPDIALTSLTRDHTKELIGSILGSLDVQEELATEVFGVSDGNPFSVIESIRSLEDTGALKWKRNQWNYAGIGNDLPDRVEWQVNQRIARLSGRRREILELAAVLGRPFDYAFIEACEVGDEQVVRDDLNWLARNNLLRRSEADRFDVFHVTIIESVIPSMTKKQRTLTHGLLGHALAGTGESDPADVGRHLAKGGDLETALPFLLMGAQELERRCAFSESLALLHVASKDSKTSELEDNLRANLLIGLIQANRFAGDKDTINTHLRTLNGLSLSGTTAIRARIIRTLVLPIQVATTSTELQSLVEESRALEDYDLALRCLLAQIRYAWASGDRSKIGVYFSEAEEACRRLNTDFHKGYLAFIRGHQHLEDFALSKARSRFADALTIFDSLDHRRYSSLTTALLGEVHFYQGDFTSARSVFATLYGSPHEYVTAKSRYFSAQMAVFEDDYQNALVEVRHSLALSENLGELRCLVAGLAMLVTHRTGEFAEAKRFENLADDLAAKFASKKITIERYKAEIAGLEGNSELRDQLLDRSLEASSGNPFQTALTQLQIGIARIDSQDYVNALRKLTSAREFFSQSEAFLYLRRVDSALGRIPRRSAPSLSVTKEGDIVDHKPTPTVHSDSQTELLDRIVHEVVSSIGAERAILAVFHGDNREPTLLSSASVDSFSARTISKTLLWEAILAGEPVVTHNAKSDTRFSTNDSLVELNVQSVVCVPISPSQATKAVLYVDHSGIEYFTSSDIKFLVSYGHLAGIAIEKSRKYDVLRKDMESLTGIRSRYGEIIGASAEMQNLYSLLDRIQNSNIPVLLMGETGTGKGLVARTIHEEGPRCQEVFVSQNCGAFNLPLLESELFGHAKGAFTGADFERIGLLEAADGGTIFLDEIGDAPPEVQIRLLQVLEEGTIRRVGENENRLVDVRIIAATHRNLDDEVSSGRFREDLLFRLRVVPIQVPSLRSRRPDILPLAGHFLGMEATAQGIKPKGLSDDVVRAFESYSWPGNIRELENEIKRGLTLAGDEERIEILHLSDAVRTANEKDEVKLIGDCDLKQAVSHYERTYVRKSLLENGWNITKTSKSLGLTRVGLQRKIKRLGIVRPNSN